MNKRASSLILLLGAMIFAAGLFQLFKLRFEAGDVYPPYSSLRPDPLGTMALFESLARMPGVTVARDFSADNLPSGRRSTYLHLAAPQQEWLWEDEDLARQIEDYLVQGGRLVVTFSPETSRPATPGTPPFPVGKSPPSNPKPVSKSSPARLWLKDRLGLEFGFVPLQAGERNAYQAVQVQNQTPLLLPQSLEWHSGMVFTNLNAAWTAVYSRGTNAVVIERKFGPGSVVMVSDSFCISNEAMVEDRHPDLLAWIVGSSRHIEFDESHLGLVDSPGIAGLMRQYRLHGVIAGLLLLAALFIWKHSMSFVPRSADERASRAIAGKEAAEGFVNLLRRNIARQDLLRVCFDEWTKSFVWRGAHSISRVDQVQAVFEAEVARAKPDQNPVRAYREMSRALQAKKAAPEGPAT
jgi:hypothetical protein